jgi:hypothetical protein
VEDGGDRTGARDRERLRETETEGGVGRRGRGVVWLKTVADRWGPHVKKEIEKEN